MKLTLLNSWLMACRNKPQVTISDNYNRIDFNANNESIDSYGKKNETNDNSVSKKMTHEFVDFSGGMLGI
ncbi:MAG: hypothetical protein WBM13_00105 [Bacteroidia bacterium]